jgi:pyridinium-3,5-biscarboxylic acid mononucleotide sulfurtransferase
MKVLSMAQTVDDLRDYRPGTQSLIELGIRSPLLEVGLAKCEVRALSRKLGLSTADKAAFACLATRIPYGCPLTLKNLAQVEACEGFLHLLGLQNFRARHHGETVRIEVTEEDLPRLIEKSLRSTLIEICTKAGFRYVTLDLEGYRTGRMNEELS